MLQIAKNRQMGDVMVYESDENDYTFHVLPQSPRLRFVDDKPMFKFVKYRQVRQEGENLFGGICVFDTEIVLAPEKLVAVTAALQEQVNGIYQARGQQPPAVVIAPLTYVDGTATLNIGQGTTLVQTVKKASRPSSYGRNVATFWVELTQEGATLFEKALQGQGGFVSVIYEMTAWAKLPPIRARAWWHANTFYAFMQHLDTSQPRCSDDTFDDNVLEVLTKADVMNSEFEWVGNPSFSPDDQRKVETEIRSTIMKQLADTVARNMLAAVQTVDPDTTTLRQQSLQDIQRTVTKVQIADVNIHYGESQVIQWRIAPQGILPNITAMNGPDGKPFEWKDYSVVVDLDDPFFRTLEVFLRVNADFADLPIFNVETKISYPYGTKPVDEFAIAKPDEVQKFVTALVDDHRDYKYSYQVNYKGDSRKFQSPEFQTDDTQLTVNVDDLGILVVDIAPGDINFTQVRQAQIKVRYEDAGITPIERQFTMAPGSTTFRIREVLFQERTQPILYDVKYFMADGREFEIKGKQQDASQIFINDPFSAFKTVGVHSIGDMTTRIQQIPLDLIYRDAANNYTQTKSIVLSKAMKDFDWSFPVIDENAGETTYSGSIQYLDGTTRIIPPTKLLPKEASFNVGDLFVARMKVQVLPDLLDFERVVRLATVGLHYVDDPDQNKALVFKKGATTADPWFIQQRDTSKRTYTWDARYFMFDGSKKDQLNQTSTEENLVLELP